MSATSDAAAPSLRSEPTDGRQKTTGPHADAIPGPPTWRGRRIAILGNMNNAGFTMLRYFRDLGADAHLLLWANDGVRSAAHFAPEADTWEIARWQPYIRRLGLSDSLTSVVPDAIGLTLPPPPKRLAEELAGFDFYIGSGAAPAVFARCGMRLDVFWPYSIGVEWLDSDDMRQMCSVGLFERPRLRGLLNRMPLRRLRTYQAEGIRQARYCFNAEMGPTAGALRRLGRTSTPLQLPAVYNGPENQATAQLAPVIAQHEADLSCDSTFKLFCAARWQWDAEGALPIEERRRKTKNSEMILYALQSFRQRFPAVKVRLFTFEYGSHVEASKRLAESLGVAEMLVWLPTAQRRQLRLLLSRCDVAIGEFYIDPGILWGSTGWEALAAGKPLIHAVNFAQDEFELAFDQPRPPIVDAKSPEQITEALCALHVDPVLRSKISQESVAWFATHQGQALARRWLDQMAA